MDWYIHSTIAKYIFFFDLFVFVQQHLRVSIHAFLLAYMEMSIILNVTFRIYST